MKEHGIFESFVERKQETANSKQSKKRHVLHQPTRTAQKSKPPHYQNAHTHRETIPGLENYVDVSMREREREREPS